MDGLRFGGHDAASDELLQLAFAGDVLFIWSLGPTSPSLNPHQESNVVSPKQVHDLASGAVVGKTFIHFIYLRLLVPIANLSQSGHAVAMRQSISNPLNVKASPWPRPIKARMVIPRKLPSIRERAEAFA